MCNEETLFQPNNIKYCNKCSSRVASFLSEPFYNIYSLKNVDSFRRTESSQDKYSLKNFDSFRCTESSLSGYTMFLYFCIKSAVKMLSSPLLRFRFLYRSILFVIHASIFHGTRPIHVQNLNKKNLEISRKLGRTNFAPFQASLLFPFEGTFVCPPMKNATILY